MKIVTSFLLASACFLAAGCGGSGTNEVVTEGLEQSKIDEYNRMVAESEASMMQGVEAEKAALKADPKGLKSMAEGEATPSAE
ncbi:hypothetical protein [Rubripirellula tenax]|nr:hypothetical protein [Rubripirellula tenax]